MKDSIFSRRLLLSMALLLPFWLTFGRMIFGSGGWISIIYLFTVAPALFVILLAFYFLLKNNYNQKITCLLGGLGYWLLPALYASTFLHGFFMIDASDSSTGYSAATNLFGSGVYNLSNNLSIVLFLTMLALTFTTAISLIVYTVKHKNSKIT